MWKKSDAAVMIKGTINSGDIFDAHTKIKGIVESFKEVNRDVNSITNTAKLSNVSSVNISVPEINMPDINMPIMRNVA